MMAGRRFGFRMWLGGTEVIASRWTPAPGARVSTPGALARGLLLATLIVSSFAILPLGAGDARPMVVLAALVVGVLVTSEYLARSPTLIEFRDAPPYNRMRLAGLAAAVLGGGLMMCDPASLGPVALLLQAIGARLGDLLDVTGSPVAMIGDLLPRDVDAASRSGVLAAAAVAYLSVGAMLGAFYLALRRSAWPRAGGFNIWVNLPHFDPTAGGDLVQRLARASQGNLALGFLLPFVIPLVALALGGSGSLDPISDPGVVAWMLAIWAFAPANLVMRGLALHRLMRGVQAQRARSGTSARSAGAGEPNRLRAA